MSQPWGRFARSKTRQGDSLRHQIRTPCPHSPLTAFTLIGALFYIKYKLHPKFLNRYLFTGRYLSVIKMDEVDRDAATKEEEDLKTTVDRECATVDNEHNTNGMISD